MHAPTYPARTPAKIAGKIIGKRTSSLEPTAPLDAERVHDRIALDGGHADVESEGSHVEVTVRLSERAVLGLALSPAEADRIADALHTAARAAYAVEAADVDIEGVDTVLDLWHRAQESSVPASALVNRFA